MFSSWKNDPTSVHASWDAYFTNIEAGVDPNMAFMAPSNLGVDHTKSPQVVYVNNGAGGGSGGQENNNNDVSNQERLTRLFMKYRDLGHEIANVNPLSEFAGLRKKGNLIPLKENPAYHDFLPEELDKKMKYYSAIPGINNLQKEWTPSEVDKTMSEIYSGPISFEYMHIGDKEKKQWIREQIEKLPQIT